MILSTLVQSWNWLGVKYIYLINPTMNGFQVVFSRSIFSIVILIVLLNVNLKCIMVDNLPSESKKHMAMRVVTGCFGILTMNFVVKYFSLSTIAVINNLSPIVTMLLASAFLKERVSNHDIVCLFLSFLAVTMVILGVQTSGEVGKKNEFGFKLFLVCCLPVSMACSNITMRLMQKLNEYTVSCYLNLTVLIVTALIISYRGGDFKFFGDL
jgi:drug/metabolite transporter (DMT)-like permease